MGKIVGPETLVFNLNQALGNYSTEDNLNTENHGESLKFNIIYFENFFSSSEIWKSFSLFQ
jgi:hypothetical protein